jgi:hypothetical protein
MDRNGRARAKNANGTVVQLHVADDEEIPLVLCAMPPSRGNYKLHGFDCRIVRRCDGILGCYIRVPVTHELYGRTNLRELSFALECADGITYSAGGADGWYIGSATQLLWQDACALLEYLARQLAEFTPSDEHGPHVRRDSGIQLRIAPNEKPR